MLKEAFYKGFVARHGIQSLGKKDAVRLLKGLGEKGSPTDSLFLWPLKALSKKVLGKTHDRIGRNINKFVYDVDTIAGKPLDYLAKKLPITKNLFKQEELIPTGKDAYKKVMRTSLTAPMGEAGKIVMPLAASSYVYDKLKKKQDQEGTI